MTNDQDKKQPSRLDRHLSILGLGDSLPEDQLAAERRLMTEARPKRLTFPAARKPGFLTALADHRSKWQMGLAGLAAAVIAVVLYKNPSPSDGTYTIKGGAGVAIYFEQGGQVKAWTTGTVLAEGAKVRAEVLAVKPTMAFWGVTAKGGRLLSESHWILENRLPLAAGEKKFFPGSLELSGPSEGEVLVVAICPEGYVKLEAPETPELLSKMLLYYSTDTLAECKTQRFQLR